MESKHHPILTFSTALFWPDQSFLTHYPVGWAWKPTVFDLIFKIFFGGKKNSWKKSIFQGRGSRLAVKQCCPSLRGGIHNWCGGSIQVFMLGKGLLKCIPIPFFSVQNEKEKNAGRVRITVWNSYLSAKNQSKGQKPFCCDWQGWLS